MPLMPPERMRTKDAYLAAFAAANPGKKLPIVYYERGWWCIKGGGIFASPARYRHGLLLEMTERLVKRATVPATELVRQDEAPKADESR